MAPGGEHAVPRLRMQAAGQKRILTAKKEEEEVGELHGGVVNEPVINGGS